MQDPTQVTKAPKITKEMAEVNFETMSAEEIERLHRAIGHQVNYSFQARISSAFHLSIV